MSPAPSSTVPAPSALAEFRAGGSPVNTSPGAFSEPNIALPNCHESLKSAHPGPLNASLKRVLIFIDQNYTQKLTLETIANSVYLNKTYISQMFTKRLGITFGNYLENVRINKAQELLNTTDMSIWEIADAVGYSSSSYFSKVFTKRVGMSPMQYRDTMSGKQPF